MYTARMGEGLEGLLGGDVERWWYLGRRYRLATELAFNKRRASRLSDDEGAEARVEKLRAVVAGEDLGAVDEILARSGAVEFGGDQGRVHGGMIAWVGGLGEWGA